MPTLGGRSEPQPPFDRTRSNATPSSAHAKQRRIARHLHCHTTWLGYLGGSALVLVEVGELGLEASVADYWPEFEASGQERIKVRMALTSSLGIPLRFGIGYALPQSDTFPYIPDGCIVSWRPRADAIVPQPTGACDGRARIRR